MVFSKYKPLGISNPMNIGLAFIVTLILSMFLGWLYNVIFAAPFMIIYLNFIITIGLGFALAISIQIISKLLKIRERKTRLFLVIFAVIIAYYSHWISYILHLSFEKIPNFSQFISYWIYPENLFLIITDINKYGTWSFGLSGNLPVKGFILFLIWLAEALVIFFIAISYTFKFPENPFSEKSNKWYSKLTLDYDFNSFYSEEKIINSLKEEGIDLILNAEKGLAYKYASVTVFFLEKEDAQYLSIDNIFIERKNKSKKNTTAILSPITISNEDANKLISKFGTKKEFFLDF